MTVLDLTHPVDAGMCVFPGDPPVLRSAAASVEQEGYAVTAFSLGSHTGTHMDAPAHVLSGVSTLDAMHVETFLGCARVADCTGLGPGEAIGPGLLAGVPQADFILLHTGWDRLWGGPEYFASHPALTAGAARLLARLARKGVGMDLPSPDPAGSASLENHRILLAAGLVLVENLTGLAALAGRPFCFCALPLSLARADGAPVRAIAIHSTEP